MKRLRRLLAVCVAVSLLPSCGDSGDEQVQIELAAASKRISDLERTLGSGALRNASILREYSSVLGNKRPELKPLLTELAKDATTEGPLFKSLEKRYDDAREGGELFESWTDRVAELQAIRSAARDEVFNDALSDTINVIADMSDGELARVNAISREQEEKANGARSFGAGSQYIGNPHYGYWSRSPGGSFWAWYGQYHFFSTMFGGRRYYYNDWAPYRGYSYYHDVGRRSYTSPSQRLSQNSVEQRARKSFGSSGRGGSFQSAYARNRTGASGISKASTTQAKSVFKSQYGSSSRSKFQSSARSASSRTSRGFSRGK